MRHAGSAEAAVVLLLCGSLAVAEECRVAGAMPARLSLLWHDDGLVADLRPGIEQELRAVFESLPVTIDWRIASPGEEPGPNEIAVLLRPDPKLEQLSPGVMGAVRKGEGTRRARVFLAPIERLLKLGPKARSRPGSVRGQKLARAIGRVAAHEVVHVIAPDLGHTREGLMQPSFTRTALAASRVPIDRSAANAVRDRLQVPGPAGEGRERYASEAPSSSCTRSL
jgi:hypothetical protein